MPALRSVCALVAGVCLVVAGGLPAACAHDISEPGLCASQCVLHDLAGHTAALLIDTPVEARLDVARSPALAAVEPLPLDSVSGDAAPRAPPQS